MNLVSFLQACGEYAAIIPAAIMCMLPVQHKSKLNRNSVAFAMIAVLSVLSIAFGVIRTCFSLNAHLLFLPLTAVMLVMYLSLYKLDFKKLWYIFLSVMALFSFAGAANYVVEAYIKRIGNADDLSSFGLIAQWSMIAAFLLISILTRTKVRWLTEDYHLDGIWKYLWIIPTLTIIANIMMIPYNYSKASVARLAEIIISDLVLLVLFLLFQVMLYIISKTVTDKAEAQRHSQMLSIQATEYNTLKKYIESTSGLRHDFRQLSRTAVELARSGDTASLIKLLESHEATVEEAHTRKLFCRHNALNAIVNYYYDEAIKNKINCSWNLAISDHITVSDVDICSLVGNLIDNAIQGTITLNEAQRRISLSADTDENGDIYIVVTNSFNGYVNMENGKYKTTKAGGSGIGLESITATVKKHNGYVRFYHDKQNFYADVMIKQPSQATV